MSNKSIAVIVGVGPGLGLAIAKKFAAENFLVIIISRSIEKLTSLLPQIDNSSGHVFALAANVANEKEIIAAFNTIRKNYGDPDILIYNAASKFDSKGICEINPQDFIDAWKITCCGGLVAAQQVIPGMLKKNKGTILFTGSTASIRGGANLATFAVGKFSQRALAQSMARELGPQGIHVAHIIVDGYIATPFALSYYPDRPRDSFLNPEAIAETYWQVYQQDKTAWTQEIDLRPYTEKF